MTPRDVQTHFKNSYQFNKQTGMSSSSFRNWVKWGYVPHDSQQRLQLLTNGVLKAEWNHK
jgi:hypothetical protein